mmetsp:Transcript_39753/g.101648  ORF Transcript_39753/g.101648 Transcript_39753/m.101648 type:complete len:281 (-) Transcript_39753:103-945(-)
MALSVQDAMRTLQQLVPDMEREVITSVLESHGGNMEAAAESLLSMAGGAEPAGAPADEAGPSEEERDAWPQPAPPSRFSMEPTTRAEPPARPQPPANLPSALVQMDELIARTLQEEELLSAVQEERRMRLFPPQRLQGEPVSSSLGAAVQGVTDTLSSISSAAYSGISSLMSGIPFASCMPTSAAHASHPWERDATSAGLHSPPRAPPTRPASASPAPPHRDGPHHRHTDSGPDEAFLSGPAAMQMGEPSRYAIADEEHPAPPSVSRLVHRRGHADKKAD